MNGMIRYSKEEEMTEQHDLFQSPLEGLEGCSLQHLRSVDRLNQPED